MFFRFVIVFSCLGLISCSLTGVERAVASARRIAE